MEGCNLATSKNLALARTKQESMRRVRTSWARAVGPAGSSGAGGGRSARRPPAPCRCTAGWEGVGRNGAQLPQTLRPQRGTAPSDCTAQHSSLRARLAWSGGSMHSGWRTAPSIRLVCHPFPPSVLPSSVMLSAKHRPTRWPPWMIMTPSCTTATCPLRSPAGASSPRGVQSRSHCRLE